MKCPQCGSVFEKVRQHQIYCSKACKKKWNIKESKKRRTRRKKAGLLCAFCCNQIIEVTRRKYCSKKCQELARRRFLKQRGGQDWGSGICLCCGEEFHKSRAKQKYCSLSCSGKGRIISERTRERISKVMCEKAKGGYQHVGFYKALDCLGNSISVRGTWELLVANWLTEHKIDWRRGGRLNYQKEGRSRYYSPDFYLPEQNLFIEVKGHFPSRDRKKTVLAVEQNKCGLLLFFKQAIKDLGEVSNLEAFLALGSKLSNIGYPVRTRT